MPLIERTMTEKNLEAHQHNAQQSHGATTPEGKERARAANLRHGYYSQLRGQALVALGEDPGALAELVEGARQQFRPTNAYQAWSADRQASLQWRIMRAERMQENLAATHVRKLEAKRREAAWKLRARWAEVRDYFQSVRHAAARPDFYSPTGCLQFCLEVLQQSPSAKMETILDLLHRLRQPRHFSKPAPPPLPEAMSDQEWQDSLRDAEGDEPSVPNPEIPVAEGKERDPLREQLWRLAAEELRRTGEAWQQAIAAKEAPLSTCARDLCVLEVSKEMELQRREERSCVREFARLANEMKKLQKAAAVPDRQAETKARDESDGKFRDETSQAESSVAAGAEEKKHAEYEGASGYVDENTKDQDFAGAVKCPPTPLPLQSEAAALHYILHEIPDPLPATAADHPPMGARVDKKLDLNEEAA